MQRKIDFKLIALIAIVILFIALFIYCFTGNGHNSLGNGNPDCQEWFEDTGIDVKNFQDRLYNIVRDGNGWLYYCSDVEGTLIPVVNELGLPTKDITIFEP